MQCRHQPRRRRQLLSTCMVRVGDSDDPDSAEVIPKAQMVRVCSIERVLGKTQWQYGVDTSGWTLGLEHHCRR